MKNSLKSHEADILTSELANLRERINRTEFAIERTEEMLAKNNTLRRKIRTAVEAADRFSSRR
ncbi:hypothetical protein FJV76_13135 [Mesorhizobium sp. WSM4303]|uniref:hypothetical protein n=1 Tax=unclassified Mesorhizobium TaxID=325217 RepID=UPI00115DA786|nr:MULTISPECIES: hypothetical protein [unclassified Mesorhizobium]TRC98267.1 hypothetical protein FJV77_07245 [Mesorhizobium sp. WSM4306]TRD04244.1 hypothetical protein FJV76_13135 [Mesorhizobium sp. WSM4303]